ncbi:MAG: purine-nucleoside phosphorylase, partial [Clostridia bacterium]|nr:purine-nucleoside phosphorylase [Clostridia bacterium]
PIADFGLVKKAVELCDKAGVKYMVGNIFSSDIFYDESNSGMEWAKMGVLGVEMESAALYCNAARAGKKALCICTVSDSFLYPEENTTAEERQNSFTKMMEIALELA